jgi:uncharacterized protein YdaU (DUF1376 family)
MNYYPHHIGDYARDTAHLTLLEDGAYRRLLDLYYSSERPLPLNREAIYRLARARTKDEKKAVDTVLSEFFTQGISGWNNKRADEEILKAREEGEEAKAKKENEKERQRRHRERRKLLFAQLREYGEVPKWDTPLNELETLLSQCQQRTCHGDRPVTTTAIHKPIANNQEPITRVEGKQRSRGSRLPADWEPDSDLKAWAIEQRPDLDYPTTLARFRDYWAALPGSRGLKLDWPATFRNWVRAEKPGQRVAPPDYSELVKRLEEKEKANAGV